MTHLDGLLSKPVQLKHIINGGVGALPWVFGSHGGFGAPPPAVRRFLWFSANNSLFQWCRWEGGPPRMSSFWGDIILWYQSNKKKAIYLISLEMFSRREWTKKWFKASFETFLEGALIYQKYNSQICFDKSWKLRNQSWSLAETYWIQVS